MNRLKFFEELNISNVADDKTARTNIDSALQRAENLYVMDVKSVLELCVGPSLKTLDGCYSKFGISVTGNDIDYRWKQYYSEGKWIIGDCFKIDYSKYDAVVFAPPLSKGCSGKREDSLSIDNVVPSYYDFIESTKDYDGVKVLVLPARSMSTSQDKNQFYKLIDNLNKYYFPDNYDIVALKQNKRNITKYFDIYING